MDEVQSIKERSIFVSDRAWVMYSINFDPVHVE